MHHFALRVLAAAPAALLSLSLLAGCATVREPSATAQREAPAERATRTVTLLAMNDVYRIAAVDGGLHGGLARLRTLRRQLEAESPELLLLHAGDLLSPSLLSGTFFGAQMIDVLNRLDGDTEGFDERMFLTFGNHEFDRGKLHQAEQLDRRLQESDFRWVSSNVNFVAGEDGRPVIEEPNLVHHWITESGGVRVGILGLTVDFQSAQYIDAYRDPVAAARQTTAELRRQGAELVIALTHETAEQDAQLLASLGDDGPDLVVGGHEHDRLERCVGGTIETLADGRHLCAGGRPLVKADADLRTAVIWSIEMPTDAGRPKITYRWQALGPDEPAEDAIVRRSVDNWQNWFDEIFCNRQLTPSEPAGCLSAQVGATATELFAEELDIRRFETNFGDWLADQTRAAWNRLAAADPSIPRPDLAFLNSGSIRLNQNLPPGPIRRRQIEELFPYPTTLALFRTTGAQLQQIVDHSISEWNGNGHFLQIAGFAFRHRPDRGTAGELTLLTETGPRAIGPDEEFVVATLDFLVNPADNQDGYTMIRPDQVLRFDVQVDLRGQVLDALKAAGDGGIMPGFEGRICTVGSPPGMPGPAATSPCLAVEAGE